jgi:hypothetical protein
MLNHLMFLQFCFTVIGIHVFVVALSALFVQFGLCLKLIEESLH